jgi:beta-N-acetylhexosaminidase
MGGIAKGFTAGEAAVRALEAGADTLLMTPDPEGALKTVLAAIQNGRLDQRRIEESVARILAAKERVGLGRRRFVDLEAIGDEIDSPESNQRAQQIADRAVTLVRNQGNLVPLGAPARTCFVALSENRYSAEGQAFTAEVRKREKGAVVTTLDPSMPPAAIDQALAKLPACEVYAVAAFAAVSAYRGNLALAGDLPRVVETLAAGGKPVILISLGNPYLLRGFPKVGAYLATFSTVPPAEIAAVKALFGEIAIGGRLPVSIPGLARYGDGIAVPARAGAAR